MAPKIQVLIILMFLGSIATGSPRQASGVISGRVVDDNGRPMRGLEVKALAFAIENGKRVLAAKGNAAKTNDRGEFRLFWLEPAAYYVVVSMPQLTASPSMTIYGIVGYIPSDTDSIFVTTYFPGTPEIGKAQPIEVGTGEVDVHAIPMMSLPR